MSVMTYTCEQCGDTGRDVLEVINGQNWCEECKEEGAICDECGEIHDEENEVMTIKEEGNK